MIVVGFVALVLLIAYLRHRAHRRSALAGLVSERPVFSVEPPTRRLTSRRWEAL